MSTPPRTPTRTDRLVALHEQLTGKGVDENYLREIESRDNLFPDADWTYWK